MAKTRKASGSQPDTYTIRHVENSAADDGTGVTIEFYSPDLVPDVEGALAVAFRIIQRGNQILKIMGPDGFQMTGAAVHQAFAERER